MIKSYRHRPSNGLVSGLIASQLGSIYLRLSRRYSNLFRYASAMLGPVIGSVSQFLLSVQVLHTLPQADFGSFAFLLVLFQFTTGVSNAILCAPLPVVLNDAQGSGVRSLKGILGANLIMCALSTVAFIGCGLSLRLSAVSSVIFGLYCGVALLRWFARSFSYATARMIRTVLSDIVYGLTLIGFSLLLWLVGISSVADAAAALLLSSLISLAPFGAVFFRAQFRLENCRDILSYLPVWRQHAQWSLIGVVTTDATANAHAYIVTALAGPAGFAPLAATALLIRPIGVLMGAVGEYERARLARSVQTPGGADEVMKAVKAIWGVLASGWIASCLAAIAVLAFAASLVFPHAYSRADLVCGATLWLIVAGIRCFRAPQSILMQSTGRFKALASASVTSCWISIISVCVVFFLAGPVPSLGGIIAGELCFAFMVHRKAEMWQIISRLRSPELHLYDALGDANSSQR